MTAASTASMLELGQPTFSHSVKIEDTAKGIRISIHVYTDDLDTAVLESVKLYQDTRKLAEKEKIPIAPVEGVNK